LQTHNKIPLVLVHTGFFSIPRLKDLFENFFQFETYDSHKSYPKNALFYNEKIITERVITKIINPLIEYAEI